MDAGVPVATVWALAALAILTADLARAARRHTGVAIAAAAAPGTRPVTPALLAGRAGAGGAGTGAVAGADLAGAATRFSHLIGIGYAHARRVGRRLAGKADVAGRIARA